MISLFKKQILFAAITGVTACGVFAQYEAAVFDYQNGTFNNGQVLKAETNLMISGAIQPDINRVEVSVYHPEGNQKKALYTNQWKRSFDNNSSLFQIPFNYYLGGNEQYDFVIRYFKTVTPEEKEALRTALYNAIDNFVEQSFYVKRKKNYSNNPEKAVVAELNAITADMLEMYRGNYEKVFFQYSSLITDYIELMTDKRLTSEESESIVIYKKDELGKIAAYLDIYEKRQIKLKKMLHQEIDAVLTPELLVCTDTRVAKEYKTEKVRGELPVNLGYGTILLDNNYIRPDFGLTPFIGVSMPLSNAAFGSGFLSNSSLSAGILTNTFKDRNENIVKGPLFNRPLYVSYGYRALKFIRINAGTAVVQVAQSNANASGLNTFSFRPFVGVSAEINLSMRLGSKK
ncbi:MAG: hypothetical protein K1X92_00645 [Bacteroidia bacterium]|nr:hypothetical protein [Bacteroidia bacterium]